MGLALEWDRPIRFMRSMRTAIRIVTLTTATAGRMRTGMDIHTLGFMVVIGAGVDITRVTAMGMVIAAMATVADTDTATGADTDTVAVMATEIVAAMATDIAAATAPDIVAATAAAFAVSRAAVDMWPADFTGAEASMAVADTTNSVVNSKT